MNSLSRLKQSAQQVPEEVRTPAVSAGPQVSTSDVSRSFHHFSLKKKNLTALLDAWCLLLGHVTYSVPL